MARACAMLTSRPQAALIGSVLPEGRCVCVCRGGNNRVKCPEFSYITLMDRGGDLMCTCAYQCVA